MCLTSSPTHPPSGDHEQLRPKPQVYTLTAASRQGYDLDVSLFERLVTAGSVRHVTLETQRRMRPSISRWGLGRETRQGVGLGGWGSWLQIGRQGEGKGAQEREDKSGLASVTSKACALMPPVSNPNCMHSALSHPCQYTRPPAQPSVCCSLPLLPASRRLIRAPLYPNLRDHPQVLRYPPVAGMVREVFFLDHGGLEGGQEDSKSKYNRFEVDFALGLAK